MAIDQPSVGASLPDRAKAHRSRGVSKAEGRYAAQQRVWLNVDDLAHWLRNPPMSVHPTAVVLPERRQ